MVKGSPRCFEEGVGAQVDDEATFTGPPGNHIIRVGAITVCFRPFSLVRNKARILGRVNLTLGDF